MACFLSFCLLSLALSPALGRNFFPLLDAGQIRLHVRAPAGTRIEEMPGLIERLDARIGELVPHHEVATVLDNIGGPYTPF